MLTRILTSSRYVILLAVFGSLFGAFIILGYGTWEVLTAAWHVLRGLMEMKALTHEFIVITDTFLIGTVLYMVALGLYELFIDEHMTLPAALHIGSLDDLKAKLIGVIVLSLAVLFLGLVANADNPGALLPAGAGIALVIVALTWKVGQK